MKYLLLLIISINIFSIDFRENSWGSSSEKILEKEKIKLVLYKENLKSKTYKTFKGDYQYNYKIDEYSFDDTLESLGEFVVTYSFLQDKLIKGTYTKEFESTNKINIINKTDKLNKSMNDLKNFEKAKQYLHFFDVSRRAGIDSISADLSPLLSWAGWRRLLAGKKRLSGPGD